MDGVVGLCFGCCVAKQGFAEQGDTEDGKDSRFATTIFD